VHTAIVGGGLAGLSAAYHLLQARPDQSVVVLEAGRIGNGASLRSTGMLTPGVAQDAVFLIRRCGVRAARRLYEESLRSVDYVGELAASEGIECELRMTGQLIVAHGPRGRRRIQAHAHALERLGAPHALLSDDALERVIRLNARSRLRLQGDGPGAIRLPRAGSLHPGRLLSGLANAIERKGGIIHEESPVIEIGRGSPVTLRLSNGRQVTASKVVLATNGYTDVGPSRGRIIPLHLRLLVTQPISAAALQSLGWAGREGVIDSRRIFNYYRLTEDRRILFGGGPPRYRWAGGPNDLRSGESDLEALSAQLRQVFPIELKVAGSWTGMIGMVPDSLPIIGPSPGNPSVVCMGGWCGHGIALSVMAGRWVTDIVHNGKPPWDSPWFRSGSPTFPTEPLRWTGTRAAIWCFGAMDRWE
jgi:gamma-glutamylputrescine oxidase